MAFEHDVEALTARVRNLTERVRRLAPVGRRPLRRADRKDCCLRHRRRQNPWLAERERENCLVIFQAAYMRLHPGGLFGDAFELTRRPCADSFDFRERTARGCRHSHCDRIRSIRGIIDQHDVV